MAPITDAELKHRFLYHPPNERARELHAIVSAETLALACKLAALVPESRGLSLALTHLEEVRMWANQAIATNHDKLT